MAIRISRDHVAVTFTRAGLVTTLQETQDDTGTLVDSEKDAYRISSPVCLKRCGLETRLIIDNVDPAPAHHRSTHVIQETLAKALVWNETLLRGEVTSTNALAKREDFNQCDIARLLSLAWLAPDIMESIMRGDIPSTPSLARLKKSFPLDWKEQRKVLGFTH